MTIFIAIGVALLLIERAFPRERSCSCSKRDTEDPRGRPNDS